MSNTYLDAITRRRTQYALGRNVTQSKDEVTALIQEAIRQAPSSFNSQSSRAVILHGEQSVAFWDIVKDELRKIVPADAFAATEGKINSFAAGTGTVLFYEDQDVVKGLQEQFPLYADNFPVWSEQSSGIAQYAVWVALSEAGIGASLQHYNPLPDAAVAAKWGVPASWKLRAQMPFGSNEAGFGEKGFIDNATRFIVAG
ncbi:nitroreductase family protein [Stenotrophomonas sp. W1S232]|uniref:Nitroreductase family protein n=1 Tax=Stenotrophomonas koreensis TaxID=266128 RepID=A0A7W3UZ58_9GAMM|nr:nitroreductase family protein [Stenotrophomonas koreensis]MBB1116032.1 nitroreductase family protein [Stenotrophomonas koreensis]